MPIGKKKGAINVKWYYTRKYNTRTPKKETVKKTKNKFWNRIWTFISKLGR